MCGLVGAIGKNIDIDIINDLFLATEPRGKEATGFWTPHTDTIKAALGAEKFLNEDTKGKLKEGIEESNILLGHCRYATHGKPEFNYNNHPIESENWIVVHNGVVSIKDFDDYQYTSDTDTENIVAYIERFGLVDGLSRISSGASIILYHRDEPDSIYVWRTATGDLLVTLDLTNETIYVCSGDKYMKDALETKCYQPEGYNGLFTSMDRQVRLSEPMGRDLWKLSYDSENESLSAKCIKTVPLSTAVGAQKLDWKKGQEIAKLTAHVGRGKLRPGVLEGRVKIHKPKEPVVMQKGTPAYVRDSVLFFKEDVVKLTRDVGPTDAIYCTSGDQVEAMKAGTQFKVKKILKRDRYAVESRDFKMYVMDDDMLMVAESPSCMGVMLGASPDLCDECFFKESCELLSGASGEEEAPPCTGTFDSEDDDCMQCEYIAYCINQTWNTETIDAEYREIAENEV